MKFNFTLLIFFSFSLFSTHSNSQDISSTLGGGEYELNKNRSTCLTDEQREDLLIDIKTNITK